MTIDTTAGRLIYVVGPSGAGKDSVIAVVREKLNKIKYLCFAPRYVTRPDGGQQGELSISHNAFEQYPLSGHFALYWQAHGLQYGVSVLIDQQLRGGRTVVVNGSRANLDTALSRYPHMRVVHICVPPAVARARLMSRGREDAAAIARRLARAPAFTLPLAQLVTIDNSGPLEFAVAAFTRALTSEDAARGFGWLRRAGGF